MLLIIFPRSFSNVPDAVPGFKFFETTDEYEYFERELEIYEWTKKTLQDRSDYLYFDKVDGNHEFLLKNLL